MKFFNISEHCDYIIGTKISSTRFIHPSTFGQILLNSCCNFISKDSDKIFIDSDNFLINNKFYYSISNTDEYAVAAVSKYKIGIDCIKIEKRVADVKEKFLNNEELEMIENSLEGLVKAFSIKEAAIKCFNLSLSDISKIIITDFNDYYSNFLYDKQPYSAYHDLIKDHIFTLVTYV